MSSEQRMPFGKFKGVPIGEIETSYLQWLHKTVELREPLRSAVSVALSWKAVPVPPAPGVAGTPAGRTSQEGASTLSTGHSKRFNRSPQHREAARPKRAWRPGPETENLSEYYSSGSNDGIEF